ncbi:hypothetical protein PIB30_024444 [Stylosanthes scabra]|uniref:RRM domain-containing protein n=1 Tax=Stylosanthes scabra TaxID=79078 RepID=A0ABU6W991_9FABA|nr:hypothetical protein [Stylosanthes scabra]
MARRVFNSTGRVVDIFLSQRVRERNTLKFAFIRYKTKEEATNTIEQLNGWIVWGCKITLSESKYRRMEEADKRKSKGIACEIEQGNYVRKVMVEENDSRKETGSGRTFKEALMNEDATDHELTIDDGSKLQTLGNSKIYLEEDETAKERLERSVIGETLEPYKFEELKHALLVEWQSLKEIRMMGAMKIVMTFDVVQSMEEALSSDCFLNHFLEVRRWSRGEANRTRDCWIEVTGLPLHGWTTKNMEKIAKVWGKVITIERAKDDHCSYFRALIVMNLGPTIRAMANVVIAEETFSIFVSKLRGSIDQKVEGMSYEGSTHLPVAPSLDVAVMEEDEGSKVGETQPMRDNTGENAGGGVENTSPVLNVDSRNSPSPTKTISLEDDRRTNDVIREWEEVCYQKSSEMNGATRLDWPNTGPGDSNVDPNENGSPSLSAPPGFERIEHADTETESTHTEGEGVRTRKSAKHTGGRRHQKTVLKLNDKLKEKARKKKEICKQK